MNDDFSGPPGMDARRADGDRDVAWARGLKNRENEGNAPEAKSWACFCSCKTGISAIHGGQV
ncbi:hypothetical protein [Thalassolituus marinus]|uniref:Uncharacterized protein n=1 Tax=Thalassolituus marinus TaxID=671053 RepID=A0ABS7ZTJ4_9GAMM|nr:hypothetical protein [Thalassolituus marinus]MCA6065068.1 hypothetical protein [Thalassolituus marinus]